MTNDIEALEPVEEDGPLRPLYGWIIIVFGRLTLEI